MTPKEQAKELVGKYNLLVPIEFGGMDKNLAIQCALIAVDEMLNEYPSQCPKDSYEMERHIFWQEVKQELLNMK